MDFDCENCNFSTINKKDWFRHLNSNKHIIKCLNEEIEEQKEFHCKVCNIGFDRVTNYNRHLKTIKHRYSCISTNDCTSYYEKTPPADNKTQCVMDALIEQNKVLMNIISNSTIPNNNNNNNNNNTMNNSHNTMINKNKFNLNIFLNEECKDAINMTDFINNITLTLKDLEQTAQLGYTAGITKIINDRVQEIGLHKRPYHCTDKKRETVYVKDANLWEKEQDDKPKMKKMIKKIIHKNLEQLSEWKSANPECTDLSNRKGEQYLNMMVEVNGGNHVEEKEVKILQNLTEMATLMKPL